MNAKLTILASLVLAVSMEAHAAGDLITGGALSGAGQGLERALAQWQAFEAQRALMQEQDRLAREREERAWAREKEAAEQERARRERLVLREQALPAERSNTAQPYQRKDQQID